MELLPVTRKKRSNRLDSLKERTISLLGQLARMYESAPVVSSEKSQICLAPPWKLV